MSSKNDSEVSPLDEETPEFFYIKSKGSKGSKKVWEIDYPCTKKVTNLFTRVEDVPAEELYGISKENPVIIDSIEEHTFPFIIKYIESHSERDESEAPKAPLKDTHISNILGDEYPLFEGLYDEKDDLNIKLVKLSKYVNSALYFGFEHLHKKLSAVVACLIKGIDLEKLKSTLNETLK